MNDTPFRTSGRVVGEDFFGRADTIRQVVQHLRGKSNVAVMGGARSGKTSFLTTLFRNYKRAERDAATWFVDMKNLATLNDLIAEFYYGMKINTMDSNLRDFNKQLRNLRQRFVIFIDNADRFAEPAFNEEAFFAVLASNLQSQIISVCVTTTLPPEKIFTNRVGLPLHSYFARYDLTPFTPEECEQFIKRRLQWTGVFFSNAEIIDLIEDSKGQPSVLQRLAADLYRLKTREDAGGIVRTAVTKRKQ
jgi:hypothetical protein